MKNWIEDMLRISENATCEKEVFRHIEVATHQLGFEYCAYGLQMPLPMTSPKVVMINNYPIGWQKRYAAAGYLALDPTVMHGRQSLVPLVWTEDTFASSPTLLEEAKSFGINVGWVQSCFGPGGAAGMLTLSRSCHQLNAVELASQQQRMRWLVIVTHLSMSRIMCQTQTTRPSLSPQEIEVLKWTADGKTATDIGEILTLSKATIDFHIKNAVIKLQVPNKTAATVRAAMLGLLY